MRRALALALIALTPSLASAQDAQADVVVIGLGGDATPEVMREAHEAVGAALAEDGLRVLPAADVGMRVSPARLARCRSRGCAWQIGIELRVSMVAAVTTWVRDGRASSLTVSLITGADRSHTATEAVGEAGLVRAARGAVTGAQQSRRRTLIVEGTMRAHDPVETPEVAEIADPNVEASPLRSERPLDQWVLPSLLGLMGFALVGASVYAMLDEQCDLVGASGICLAGDRPNYGLGVTFAVLGVLSIAGAFLWLIVGGEPSIGVGDMDNVVFGREGVGVRF